VQGLVPDFMKFVTRPWYGFVLRCLAFCLIVVAIIAAGVNGDWAGFTPVVWMLLALAAILGVIWNEIAQIIGRMDAKKHAHAFAPLAAPEEVKAPAVAQPVAPFVKAEASAAPAAKPAAFEVEIYCVKCRDKRTIQDPAMVALANGRPAYQGSCPVCGTTVTRIRKAT